MRGRSGPAKPWPMTTPSFVLRLACANRPGIVLAVSRCLYEAGCDILDAQQFDDRYSKTFFARFVFRPVDDGPTLQTLSAAFAPVAEAWGMQWTLRPEDQRAESWRPSSPPPFAGKGQRPGAG